MSDVEKRLWAVVEAAKLFHYDYMTADGDITLGENPCAAGLEALEAALAKLESPENE